MLPNEAKDVRVAKPTREGDWKGEGELFVVVVVVVVIPNHLSTLTVEDLCTMYVHVVLRHSTSEEYHLPSIQG